MFGIGTIEMLVIGAVLWMALRGKVGAAAFVWAGVGLLVLIAWVGIIISLWNTSRVVPSGIDSSHIAPDGTQYWVSDRAAHSGVVHPQWTPDGKQYWPGDAAFVPPVNVGNTTWSFTLRPALFIGVGVIALLFVAARRGLAHTAGGGHGRIWPAFVALPLLAFLVIGGMKWEASTTGAAAARKAAEMRESMLRQQQAFQRTFDEQRRKAISQQVTAAKAKVHQHIEQMDIHELMDKFDAPRIVLQAPMPSLGPTSGSATFLIAAATTAAESAKQETKDKAKSTEAKADTEVGKPEADATVQAEDASPKSDSETTRKVDADTQAKAEAKATAVVEAEAPAPPVVAAPPVPPAPPVAAKVAAKHSAEEVGADAVAKPAAVRLETTTAEPPTWINDQPKRTGDVRREVIATEEYESVDECYRAADVYLMLKVHERLQQLRGLPSSETRLPSITFHTNAVFADGQMIAMGHPPTSWRDFRLAQLSQMGVTPEFLRREIVAKDPANNESREYLETATRSVGPMRKLYMQIEFTPATDRELMQFAEAYSRQERFAAVGFGAGSVLTLLTMVWGLLKIDTATKGYYTKRLFLGVPAAIIAGAIAVITWMNYNF